MLSCARMPQSEEALARSSTASLHAPASVSRPTYSTHAPSDLLHAAAASAVRSHETFKPAAVCRSWASLATAALSQSNFVFVIGKRRRSPCSTLSDMLV